MSGKANVSDTKGMMDSMEYIQKWKDLGMLDGSNSDPIDDAVTKDDFIKGNTLFMLGSQNGITDSDATTDEFGLMPYLSEDGSKNVYILSVGRYYGLNKKLEDDSQKLEDALKVMEVLSAVEGTSSPLSGGITKKPVFCHLKMQRQTIPIMAILQMQSMQEILHLLFIPAGKILSLRLEQRCWSICRIKQP